MKINYTAPKQNVKLVIEQLSDILKQPVVHSYFYAPAQKDSTPAFAKALHQIIEQQIYPRILAYKEFLSNDYLSKAREELSISSIPNGAVCYKALSRSSTSLSIAPDDVFSGGIKAVAQREDKFTRLGSRLYGTNDFNKIKEQMRLDTSNRFSSKEELVAFSDNAVARAKNKVASYFGLVPTASLEIKPMPDYQQSGFFEYNFRRHAWASNYRTIFKAINQLPEDKAKAISEFADFVAKRHEEEILTQGIQELATTSKSFYFLYDEEDFYSEADLEKVYNGQG